MDVEAERENRAMIAKARAWAIGGIVLIVGCAIALYVTQSAAPPQTVGDAEADVTLAWLRLPLFLALALGMVLVSKGIRDHRNTRRDL